jgi:hypothetical protein
MIADTCHIFEITFEKIINNILLQLILKSLGHGKVGIYLTDFFKVALEY